MLRLSMLTLLVLTLNETLASGTCVKSVAHHFFTGDFYGHIKAEILCVAVWTRQISSPEMIYRSIEFENSAGKHVWIFLRRVRLSYFSRHDEYR